LIRFPIWKGTFARSICGHNFHWYEHIEGGQHYLEFACGNAFLPSKQTDESVLWRGTQRGAFIYAPGKLARHNEARACAKDLPDTSEISNYRMESAYQCHFGPKTSDENGGAKVSAGHYLRAQAHWLLGHKGKCGQEACTPAQEENNPWVWEDKALELHLWPSGKVDITVGSGNPGAGES
jgi:hypothetical protein